MNINFQDEKLFKLVQQTQQHDKLQIEWKQQMADVKKKLLESQTEIVKLHCKLQEVRSFEEKISLLRLSFDSITGNYNL